MIRQKFWTQKPTVSLLKYQPKANIAIASTGYSMGWTSPVNIKLQDKNATDSPLSEPLTADELAWVGSLLPVGAIFGTFINEVRGALGSFLQAFITLGFLLVYGIGPFVSYNVVAYVGVAFVAVFSICFYFMPESPMYHLIKNDRESAAECLMTIRGKSRTGVETELNQIATDVNASMEKYRVGFRVGRGWANAQGAGQKETISESHNDRESAAECLMTIRGKSRTGVETELNQIATDVNASMEKTATLADVFRGSNFKAFYISCALVFFQQFSGINAVLFYMNTIFKAAGSDLDPSIATIIIGAVQVVASMITPLVVDRLGRRLLLLVSTCGTAIGLALLGMYFLLNSQNSPVVSSIGFLPILSLVLFIVTYCWGLGPLPWAVMGELLPIEVKAVASPIATAFCWIIWQTTNVDLTKGKSLQEIQEILAGGKSKPEKA
ncbi:Facilitated trehalose transporter Tret1 [Papilio machaon]|uniref:Facilitated trehalose transporter Tret1 n=1 Tax=Papilio machaon TaxID=76193 RepID=A0A0N1PKA5_PAPMA|nr:Facilitated trehalose transporter Tret1 [Papilio machaon]